MEIILSSIFEKYFIGWGGVDWINVAQGRHQWRAIVNTVMNIPVP
jgi:hypothetical protein